MSELTAWTAGVAIGLAIGFVLAESHFDRRAKRIVDHAEDIISKAEEAVHRHRVVMQAMAMQNGRLQVAECPTCEVKMTSAATPFIAPGSQN